MLLLEILLLTLLAGLSMPAGALVARLEHIHPRWLEKEFRHSVIAFGGGALLSAVALVLVPDGIEHLNTRMALIWFLLGGLVFMLIDVLLNLFKTSASQLVAMLADFIPESIALGAAFALGGSNGLLLALLIGLQNMPEGFNAFRELRHSSHYSANRIIVTFALMALLGPVAGLVGFIWLAAYPAFVSAVMLFAAGGILYSVFQDIAPQARLARHWGPPMGAVLGFALGIAGHMLTV
ncbi:ZIP family metal transporter [Marinobacterium weihaiense]|uniref:Divalent cation transporter n=1 Tax=Marinobacterium weihaiense TaxID=2851016 RepID=A0ABS6M8L7_9GAMM|nr:divalent cation transporter [Marinobacterium weihaiense]MBV0932641.1 divalent cation transporter [Marinobacterium weihaiense]